MYFADNESNEATAVTRNTGLVIRPYRCGSVDRTKPHGGVVISLPSDAALVTRPVTNWAQGLINLCF